ncbi:MAG: hypothetical protein Ct9H300mP19_18260 [Dehalococcoidia bacterium]|nr:MAG: hypothetical protein Ct9H300mP19_18260 [Dehalococcoidia bacterium]
MLTITTETDIQAMLLVLPIYSTIVIDNFVKKVFIDQDPMDRRNFGSTWPSGKEAVGLVLRIVLWRLQKWLYGTL